jgi:hypothetical protein
VGKRHVCDLDTSMDYEALEHSESCGGKMGWNRYGRRILCYSGNRGLLTFLGETLFVNLVD